MGCNWNMPANYDAGTFESCQAEDSLPMGVYGSSTWCVPPPPFPLIHSFNFVLFNFCVGTKEPTRPRRHIPSRARQSARLCLP